ncbi:hypothetical protein F503_06850 [Ophiostoma piceae UAMH 11346]|uniref:Uncharacterized protein n=1 Tax=Ophiostoma piceae (strain UAMH 11346) TaxID=1262450 RepID=S3C6A1_OPHP1|nr:hypothetical protein F503_06850 [Ophiostoma piceae UAMH 11346]
MTNTWLVVLFCFPESPLSRFSKITTLGTYHISSPRNARKQPNQMTKTASMGKDRMQTQHTADAADVRVQPWMQILAGQAALIHSGTEDERIRKGQYADVLLNYEGENGG